MAVPLTGSPCTFTGIVGTGNTDALATRAVGQGQTIISLSGPARAITTGRSDISFPKGRKKGKLRSRMVRELTLFQSADHWLEQQLRLLAAGDRQIKPAVDLPTQLFRGQVVAG